MAKKETTTKSKADINREYNSKFHIVNIRYKPDQYKKLTDEAIKHSIVKKSGVANVTEYVRLRSLESDEGISKHTKFYKEIKFQVRKIGVNLNQMTHSLKGLSGHIDETKFNSKLDLIKNGLKEILAKI